MALPTVARRSRPPRGLRVLLRGILLTLIGTAAAGAPGRAAETSGAAAVLSDIHLNPFATPDLAARLAGSEPNEWPGIFAAASGQRFPARGEDTNHALLASALAALSKRAGDADLVIVSGDLLAHRFEEIAAQALGTSPASGLVRGLAAKAALHVADSLRAALPGRPILVALGNNDSACGDYRLEPGGAFLAALRETVRDLAGPDRIAQDFGETFDAGGYYATRHPVAAGTTILVVNDVLWSTEYRDACGTDGDQAAHAMLAWLERQLSEARAAGRRLWLVHHIPVGIDDYATLTASGGSSCPARVTPFLKEPFGSRFALLLRDYAATIQAGFSGHTHQDSYRLMTDGGAALAVEKITPAISPIFGNDPGFHLFDYERRTGDVVDFSTWHLANLEQASATVPAEWRREYVFTQAYGQPAYSAAAVGQIAAGMLGTGPDGEPVRSAFRRFYAVGRGEIPAEALPAYACAIGNLSASSYAACYCGR
jgi:sphingomyelin phosphodiesterase acid-like 3